MITVQRPGGPAELHCVSRELPPPAAGEVRLRQSAIGVNFIDTYFRSGLYTPPQYPYTPGLEGVGVVTELGPQVHELQLGQRVAYATKPMGAYARERNIPAHRLVHLPETVTDVLAAALLFKGLTAEYLVQRIAVPAPGTWVLVHSAAGGVGSLLVQWAKHLGLRVIGTVSTDAKAELARADGADEVVVTAKDDFVERVQRVTQGSGCAAVYDGVGKDTFVRSIQCVGERGILASYGQSSGKIPPFDLQLLANNSIFLTRPSLFHYTGNDAEYRTAAAEVLRLVGEGVLKCRVGQTFPLAEAAKAHTELEARRTSGSTVLIP
ncbi:MAG: quinone oxidoreductase [Planctomycetes bacterium]|nr:quinone oxidoreductase [Planctomycetota bacterium]